MKWGLNRVIHCGPICMVQNKPGQMGQMGQMGQSGHPVSAGFTLSQICPGELSLPGQLETSCP